MKVILSVLIAILFSLVCLAEQPKPNSCKYDETGASEITRKGHVKLIDEDAGTVSDAFQVAETRMWNSALKFCESENKSHEVRNFRKETPLYSKGEVWIVGGFRCASISRIK